jgi:hypothetical protein
MEPKGVKIMNSQEANERKLDEVWAKFLVTLAVEKMRKLENLERQGALGVARKGA